MFWTYQSSRKRWFWWVVGGARPWPITTMTVTTMIVVHGPDRVTVHLPHRTVWDQFFCSLALPQYQKWIFKKCWDWLPACKWLETSIPFHSLWHLLLMLGRSKEPQKTILGWGCTGGVRSPCMIHGQYRLKWTHQFIFGLLSCNVAMCVWLLIKPVDYCSMQVKLSYTSIPLCKAKKQYLLTLRRFNISQRRFTILHYIIKQNCKAVHIVGFTLVTVAFGDFLSHF